jgi:hypothetical protein
MIKIDVENHENEVLEGAKQTILNNKPIIFIENLYYGYPNVCPNPNPHQNIFNENLIIQLVDEHLTSYRDHTFKLWTIFCFQKWYKNIYEHA